MVSKTHSYRAWAIWGCWIGILVLFAFHGYEETSSEQPPLDVFSIQVLIAFGVAAVQTVYLLSGRSLFAKQVSSYSSYISSRWTQAGIVGVYALFLSRFGASWPIFCLFIAWAFALELYLMPSQRTLKQFEILQEQATQDRESKQER